MWKIFCNFADMETQANKIIRDIRITNFKSVKSLRLSDCRRINLLIGRSNVGKSNILEALALFDVPYLISSSNKSFKSLVRVESAIDLFHNGLYSENAEVNADGRKVNVQRAANNGIIVEIDEDRVKARYIFSPTLNISNKKSPTDLSDILVYFFPDRMVAESSSVGYLLPPSGNNLMEVVASLPNLKENIARLFNGYGLKMVFDSGSREIKAMKENGHDMFLIPFSSLADSLRRLIFYKAAVESNNNKVICFEEPEAHTFPPYISNVVNDILERNSNQYFITTHSPYVVSSLLECAGDDLAVFVVDMDDGATTVVTRLSDSQMQRAYDNGLDMFYNIEGLLSE